MTTITQRKMLRTRTISQEETLEQQAERLFPDAPYAPLGTVEHNREAWLAAVRYLGSKWVGRVHKKEPPPCAANTDS